VQLEDPTEDKVEEKLSIKEGQGRVETNLFCLQRKRLLPTKRKKTLQVVQRTK